ncbi:MAG: hypothetical protein U9Q05_11945 [Thermodesulfobacteriota bacterium]|nr:hypothetical protein [Thermodesulfobacteriota bacterium]
MTYPPLVYYQDKNEYRKHFEREYCKNPIITFDGLKVRFNKRDFEHAFYESINTKDDSFSIKRAQRINWIKTALQDPESERYFGWNKNRRKIDRKRRVTIVMKEYVVVIGINKKRTTGWFITAFIADSGRTLKMIRESPKYK